MALNYGRDAGCECDRREIAATIIPDRNCMVATSLLSKACAVVERTSTTPRVRRKSWSGATRIERTPRRRQVPTSTRGLDSASLQRRTSPVRTQSAERPRSVCRRTPRSGAVRPARARQIISSPLRSAIAAPVAPVRAWALSAMMLMPGSRSSSPGFKWTNAGRRLMALDRRTAGDGARRKQATQNRGRRKFRFKFVYLRERMQQ